MERRFRARLGELLDDAKVHPGLLRGVAARLEGFVRPFAESLGSDARRGNATRYVQGLLSNLGAKNVEGIRCGDDRLEWEDVAAPPLPQPFTTRIPHGNSVIENGLLPDILPNSFSAKYGTDIAKRFRELTGELIGRLRRHAPTRAPQPV